jgi:hypothetical protein
MLAPTDAVDHSPEGLWRRIVTNEACPGWVGVFTDFMVFDVPEEWRPACMAGDPSPEVLAWLEREWRSLHAAFKANALSTWRPTP